MSDWYLLDIFARGLIAIIIASFFGLLFILKGLRGELSILNKNLSIPKWLLLAVGCIFQIPLIIYLALWIFGGVLEYAISG